MSESQDKKFINKGDITGLSTSIASNIEHETQIQKYHNEKAGHGFAAEDANALNDFLHGKNVEKIGIDNIKDGADRISDGVKIQVKYYKTAKDSVNAAFSNNRYRYAGQVLEVPADQYDEAVREMQKHIQNGEVIDESGAKITDPKKAKELVQSGSITYEQARNIANAGNIDSIIFDVKNQCILSSCVLGISFAITYARNIWEGNSQADALKKSIIAALQSGTSTLVIGVITSQVLRTSTGAAGVIATREGVKFVAKTGLGKNAIEAIAQLSLGKATYGAAAINHVSKLLRSNIVTAAVATVVTSAPDFYRAAISGNISWSQFAKNLGINVAGVAGGAGGWFAGAAAGASLGSIVPVIGTAAGGIIGGVAGALGGGLVASKTAKVLADSIREDDAVMMLKILQEESEYIAFDYMLSSNEIKTYSDNIKSTVNAEWLRNMYASGSDNYDRRNFARNMLEKNCLSIIKNRKRIVIPDNDEIIEVSAITVKEMIDGKLQLQENSNAIDNIKEKIENAIIKSFEKYYDKESYHNAKSVYLKTRKCNVSYSKFNVAISKYANDIKRDDIILYVDSTLTGRGDQGICMTAKQLYYRNDKESGKIDILKLDSIYTERKFFGNRVDITDKDGHTYHLGQVTSLKEDLQAFDECFKKFINAIKSI